MSTSPSEAWSFDDPRRAKRWLVRVGADVVGPVSLDQIERGLAEGRIPLDADMAHVDRRRWCSVADLVPLCERQEEGHRRISGVQPSFVAHATRALEPPPDAAVPEAAIPAAAVPEEPPSYPEDSIEIPTHGWLRSLFG